MKEAFEKMTGMPDAWTNPALMVSRNAFIQGWEAAQTGHDADATIIQYHEATIKRLEKRIEELAQPAQEPVRWWDEKNDVVYTHSTHESDDYHGFERTVPLYPHRPPQENT